MQLLGVLKWACTCLCASCSHRVKFENCFFPWPSVLTYVNVDSIIGNNFAGGKACPVPEVLIAVLIAQWQFQPGDRIKVLLPIPGSALHARFSSPYVKDSRVSDTDYVIHTPERGRQKHLCHVNMLKLYHSREAVLGRQEKTPEAAPFAFSLSFVRTLSEDD